MMYRHNKQVEARSKHPYRRKRHTSRRGGCLVPILVLLAALLLFLWMRRSSEERAVDDDDAVVEQFDNNDENRVYRRRLLRSEIPAINHNALNYREMFNDSNYVQLSAARAGGVNPATLGNPADSRELVQIFSTRLYKVDSMYHSRPFLTPEAVLLLDYIGHRFQQLMHEYYPSADEYRIVVTSALRTAQSERNLRRVNRNATDTSAHMYGTTFDLSAQRTEHVPSGRDTVVEMCRQMLAMTLYELRYEGLCYVKYERGSCFHTTVRTTQYEGSKASEMRSYVNPGSPAYLLTKAPPRPKAQRREQGRVEPAKPVSQKKTAAKPSRAMKKTAQQKPQKVHTEEPRPAQEPQHKLTDRERISLEQFERR